MGARRWAGRLEAARGGPRIPPARAGTRGAHGRPTPRGNGRAAFPASFFPGGLGRALQGRDVSAGFQKPPPADVAGTPGGSGDTPRLHPGTILRARARALLRPGERGPLPAAPCVRPRPKFGPRLGSRTRRGRGGKRGRKLGALKTLDSGTRLGARRAGGDEKKLWSLGPSASSRGQFRRGARGETRCGPPSHAPRAQPGLFLAGVFCLPPFKMEVGWCLPPSLPPSFEKESRWAWHGVAFCRAPRAVSLWFAARPRFFQWPALGWRRRAWAGLMGPEPMWGREEPDRRTGQRRPEGWLWRK